VPRQADSRFSSQTLCVTSAEDEYAYLLEDFRRLGSGLSVESIRSRGHRTRTRTASAGTEQIASSDFITIGKETPKQGTKSVSFCALQFGVYS